MCVPLDFVFDSFGLSIDDSFTGERQMAKICIYNDDYYTPIIIKNGEEEETGKLCVRNSNTKRVRENTSENKNRETKIKQNQTTTATQTVENIRKRKIKMKPMQKTKFKRKESKRHNKKMSTLRYAIQSLNHRVNCINRNIHSKYREMKRKQAKTATVDE